VLFCGLLFYYGRIFPNALKKIVKWRTLWRVGIDRMAKYTDGSKLGSQGKWRNVEQIIYKIQQKHCVILALFCGLRITRNCKKTLASLDSWTLLINKMSALRIEFIKTAEKSDFLSNSIHLLRALETILKLQFHWHAVFRHVKWIRFLVSEWVINSPLKVCLSIADHILPP
jgi:hypothetical protein